MFEDRVTEILIFCVVNDYLKQKCNDSIANNFGSQRDRLAIERHICTSFLKNITVVIEEIW